MDIAWAEVKLTAYLDLCEQVRAAVPPGEMWNDRAQALDRQAELMISTVQRIVRELDPADTERLMPPRYSSNDGEGRVRRALGALRDLADVEVHLAATSPELPADQLHPTVWKSASVIWGTGEYRTAVGQAALSLEATIRARSNSRLSGKKLMQDVFSPDAPRPGGTRLRFDGDQEDETWRSRQLGLQLLAQGAYSGIRNVSTHEAELWGEQEALEYLAVLSVIARWTDQTNTVTG